MYILKFKIALEQICGIITAQTKKHLHTFVSIGPSLIHASTGFTRVLRFICLLFKHPVFIVISIVVVIVV